MGSAETAALTLPELAAALDAIGGFEARPLIAVAVSGGPDSLALMLLADRWVRQRGGTAWGLTVDHGLRPESAEEAHTVAKWLAARSIPHAILTWTGAKPTTGIQEAARDARYRLLADWCRAQGCLHLLTAHHCEDQAETHLIRRRAGSGVDGLAGMSAVRELPGCRLVRPLLSVPRARLAALLTAEGQPFLRDPSNLNPAFERARLRLSFLPGEPYSPSPLFKGEREGEPGTTVDRRRLAGMPAGGRLSEGKHSGTPYLTPTLSALPWPKGGGEGGGSESFEDSQMALDGLLLDLQKHGRKRIARELTLDALIGRAVALHPAGLAALDPTAMAAADAKTIERLLARVAACVGGGRYPARRVRLARLRESLAAQPGHTRTLGGCRFVPWRGLMLVLRELAAATAPASLPPGSALVWDHRFAVSLPSAATSAVTIGHLGQSKYKLPARDEPDLPRLVHAALPAFWDAQGLVAVPHLGYRREGLDALPSLSFRPSNALTRAGFTVV